MPKFDKIMIPNKFNLEEENDESLFDYFISAALAYEKNIGKNNLSAHSISDVENIKQNAALENLFTSKIISNSIKFHLELQELTIELNIRTVPYHIFITDSFGKIYYENELDVTSLLIKINTENWPKGTYNILAENDGDFIAEKIEII